MFETDSSNSNVADETFRQADEENDLAELHVDTSEIPSPEEQGKDIVAGSPTKFTRALSGTNIEQQEQEEGRREMDGIIVYDSYARMTGCEKIVNYHNGKEAYKVDQNILFSKEEAKEVYKTIFSEKARERDFACDTDRHFFKNLPRFHA